MLTAVGLLFPGLVKLNILSSIYLTRQSRHTNGYTSRCVCVYVCVCACVRACICIFKWETWRRNRHRLFSAICQFHSPTAKNKMTIYKNKYKGIRLTGVGYKLHSLQQVSHPTHVNLEPAMPTHVCPSSSKLATPATASTCFIPSPVSEQTKTLSYQHCACAGVFFFFFFLLLKKNKNIM